MVLVLTASLFFLAAAAHPSPDGPAIPHRADLVDPFVVGLNLPWIKYGIDVGENAWGHFGLSSDCAEGFRPERSEGNDGVVGCRRSQRHVHNGSYSLELMIDIARDDPERAPNGEVATDLQDIASVPLDHSLDLSFEEVSAWIYVPPGNEGDPRHPNFLQLFVKDASNEAVGLYGGHQNIPALGGWVPLSMTVEGGPPTFDPTRIRLVGVKVGIGEGSAAEITGSIWVDEIDSTHPDLGFDFEQPSRAAIDAVEITASGIRVLRWFVFADGRASPEFDADGFVTGLDESFAGDFDTAIALAGEYGFQLIPVLFDFLLCGNPDELNGAPLFGHADLIRDPDLWGSLLLNALDPLLEAHGNAPEILAWEIMNEPEWCLNDIELPPGISRPPELPPEGAVTTAEMEAFVSGIAQFLRDHPATVDPLVTLGSASYNYVGLWNATGVDLCQFHLYNCAGCLDDGELLPATSACLLGEFTAIEELTDRSVLEYLQGTCSGGYAGALPWSWRARDDFSPIGEPQQDELLAQIEDFLARPCGIFNDGFESGDTSAWSAVVP